MTRLSKTRVAIASAAVAAMLVLYIVWPRYRILERTSFPAHLSGTAVRAYRVDRIEDLQRALWACGVDERAWTLLHTNIDFENGFVFISENGQLEKIYNGADTVSYAAVEAQAGRVGVCIVSGGKNRALKTIIKGGSH
jgi:hypothetical protein